MSIPGSSRRVERMRAIIRESPQRAMTLDHCDDSLGSQTGMNQNMNSVVLVEDDLILSTVISEYLTAHG
ncbi:MAG: hypothetical protein ACK5YO_32905, partial [Planctomyces sp.]